MGAMDCDSKDLRRTHPRASAASPLAAHALASHAPAPAAAAPPPSTAEIVGAQLVLLLNQEGFGPALARGRSGSRAANATRRSPSPDAEERRLHKSWFAQRRRDAAPGAPDVPSAAPETEALGTSPGAGMSHAPARESISWTSVAPTAAIALPFRGPSLPGISLGEYMRRLTSYSGITAESVVIGFELLQRLSDVMEAERGDRPEEAASDSGLLRGLCRYTVHRAVLLSLMVAHKIHDDRPLDNRCWAYLGGINLEEINELELLFLSLVGYQNVTVSPEAYYAARYTLSAATKRYIESRKRKSDRRSPETLAHAAQAANRPRGCRSRSLDHVDRSRRLFTAARNEDETKPRGTSRNSDPNLNEGTWKGPRPTSRSSSRPARRTEDRLHALAPRIASRPKPAATPSKLAEHGSGNVASTGRRRAKPAPPMKRPLS